MSLRALLQTERTGESTAVWVCPPGHRQGRGAWGGLPIGAMLDAATAVAGNDGLAPRSLTAHLVGPLAAGPVSLDLTVLRRGSATAVVSVALTGREAGADGEPVGEPVLVAESVVAFGRDRAPDLDLRSRGTVAPPVELAAGWSAVPEAQFPQGVAPEFLSTLSIRPAGGFPAGSSPTAETVGWVSPPEGVSNDPVVLACLADAWWPATLVTLPQMRPFATLAFSLDLIEAPGTDEPLLHRGRLIAGSAGYVVESRELWSTDGRLLTQNQQTMVVIR